MKFNAKEYVVPELMKSDKKVIRSDWTFICLTSVDDLFVQLNNLLRNRDNRGFRATHALLSRSLNKMFDPTSYGKSVYNHLKCVNRYTGKPATDRTRPIERVYIVNGRALAVAIAYRLHLFTRVNMNITKEYGMSYYHLWRAMCQKLFIISALIHRLQTHAEYDVDFDSALSLN